GWLWGAGRAAAAPAGRPRRPCRPDPRAVRLRVGRQPGHLLRAGRGLSENRKGAKAASGRCLPRAAERRVTAWGRIVAFRSAKGRLAADGRMTFRGAKGDNPAPQGDSIMNRKSSIYVAR